MHAHVWKDHAFKSVPFPNTDKTTTQKEFVSAIHKQLSMDSKDLPAPEEQHVFCFEEPG